MVEKSRLGYKVYFTLVTVLHGRKIKIRARVRVRI